MESSDNSDHHKYTCKSCHSFINIETCPTCKKNPTKKLLNVDNLTQIVLELSGDYIDEMMSFLHENLSLFYSGLDHSNRDTKEFCRKILLQMACDDYSLFPYNDATFEEEVIVSAMVNTNLSERFLRQVRNKVENNFNL